MLFLFPVTINLLISCLVVVQRTRTVHNRVRSVYAAEHTRVYTAVPCTRLWTRSVYTAVCVHGLYTTVYIRLCTRPVHGRVHGPYTTGAVYTRRVCTRPCSRHTYTVV